MRPRWVAAGPDVVRLINSPIHRIALINRLTLQRVCCSDRATLRFTSHIIAWSLRPIGLSCFVSVQLCGFCMFGIVAIITSHDGPGGAGHLVGKSNRHKLEGFFGEKVSGPVGKRTLCLAGFDTVNCKIAPTHSKRLKSRFPSSRFSKPRLAAGRMLRRTRPIQAAKFRRSSDSSGSLTVTTARFRQCTIPAPSPAACSSHSPCAV